MSVLINKDKKMIYNVTINLVSDFTTTVMADSPEAAERIVEDQICNLGLSSLEGYDEDTILDNLSIEFIYVSAGDNDD